MNDVISWLHISDIHFNLLNYDTKILREKLILLLKEKGKGINFIVISGDVVYQGGKYSKDIVNFITEIIEICDLSEKEIIIVPGNHDIKRTSVRESIVKDIQSRSDYSTFDSDHIDELLKGQKSFFDFYRKVKKISGKTEFEKELHFVQKINVVNILCLNTAISCGRDGEDGSLKIDLDKLHQALNNLDKQGINIAVGHHAIDCFSQNDREKIFLEFEDHNVLLYLCGHAHTQAYSINADGTKEIETLFTGTLMMDSFSIPGFIIGEVELSKKMGTATYYCWDNKNQQWVVNNTIGRRAPNGVRKISLIQSTNIENEEINQSEFSKFIIDLKSIILKKPKKNTDFDENIISKGINSKFKKMKCSKATRKQFNLYSVYFPLINQITTEPFCSYETKILIIDEIVAQYNKELLNHISGDLVFNAMIENLKAAYKNKLEIHEDKLGMYFKALVFWCINECDIYDDEK